MPLSRKNIKIYAIFYLLWLAIFLLSEPCNENRLLQEIDVVSITALLFILSWSYSIHNDVPPNSLKNVVLLFFRSSYEALASMFLFLILCLPVIIFMPAYQCYTERAYNAEVLGLSSDAKVKITQLITSSKSLVNDYSKIDKPVHERIKYFYVTAEGMILVHAENPDYTLYLTPNYDNGEVVWTCKSFPIKNSPSICK
jgi:Tfp pilus assembly major pilin PilA